jgi:hypothetical protein
LIEIKSLDFKRALLINGSQGKAREEQSKNGITAHDRDPH